MDEIENLLSAGSYDSGLAARIRGHAAALRSYLAEISEDISIAMPLIEEALECLPEEDIRLRAFVTIRHANCLNWMVNLTFHPGI